MLDMLDITVSRPVVQVALQRALDDYAAGNRAGMCALAELACRTAESVGDRNGVACSLLMLAAGGHPGWWYQLGRASRELYRINGPDINKVVASLALALAHHARNERPEALAECQSALDHAEQAMHTAAAQGDTPAYRRADLLRSKAAELVEIVMAGQMSPSVGVLA